MINIVQSITQLDIFRRDESGDWSAGSLVGRPFSLEYDRAKIATPDAWKVRAGGIPQGCFLLAFYDHDQGDLSAAEAVLMRVLAHLMHEGLANVA